MKFHKEGYGIISLSLAIYILINIPSVIFINQIYWTFHFIATTLLLIAVLQFFRNPNRMVPEDENVIVSPADGTVVNIEKMMEKEFFEEEMIRISIFMSITSVHLNRVPIDGKLVYHKYHPGQYLMAFYEKSSEKNENMAYGIQKNNDQKIFLRQIAGFLARRIRSYVSENDDLFKGQELGFIRFGSRMDVYLPLNAKINVELKQKVFGNTTIIAYF